MKSIVQILMNTLLPIVLIVAAVLTGRALVASREGPPRADGDRRATLVEVIEARPISETVGFEVQGTVVPARQVMIQPQVSGRVQELHPELVSGGRVPDGATLLRLDARDFALTIEQLEASLAQAEANLALELGRQAVAEREWALFEQAVDLAGDETDDALATREPQVRSAMVAVEAIESQLRQARLNLSRTRVTAPFEAIVRNESVEVGQLVGPNASVATLVDVSRYWIEVSVPFDALDRMEIPGVNATEGSEVAVRWSMGARVGERIGRVVRLASELDPTGRMAVVIVEVEDPLDLQQPETARTPLVLGAFVDVAIAGSRTIQGVEVPRVALREGEMVYVATLDNVLSKRPIEVAWADETRVIASSGLIAGDRLVISRLGGVTDGMAIRVAGDAPAEDAAAAAGGSDE